jgi:hypothetical protein
MKALPLAALIFSGNISLPAFTADVGVSISVGQPGFYGRIDIGDFGPPAVIHAHPLLIEPVVLSRPVVYLRVPYGHAKDWRKHCHLYRACGERVMFVQDTWYINEYVPYYQKYKHKHKHHDGKGKQGKGHKKKHKENKQ